MADKKISQLTAATTPLAGTEVLPIVQSGSTVKVSSDDLTVKNVRSNATSGILQVTGPAAATTRVMTVPNSNFTVATTGANTFSGVQVVAATMNGNQAEFGFVSGRGLQIATALSGGTNDASSILNGRGSGAGQIEFQTDGTPRFTMELGGNLLVNTAGKGIADSSNVDRVSIASGVTVVNESGADIDLRVEGDGDANLLFVDAGADRVGVGTNTPTAKLDVKGDFNGTQAVFGNVSGRGLLIGTALNGGTNEGLTVLNARGAGAGTMSLQTEGVERVQIDQLANVTAGGGALATTATDGFLYVPTCAGTPTGTPTAKSGFAPIVVDSTNNKLYFYSGGQWRDAGP